MNRTHAPPFPTGNLRWITTGVLVLASAGLSGCKGPDSANITLRKQNQALRDEVDRLNHRHQADLALIKAREQANPATTLPMLPADQLDGLVTVAGFRLGRQTGGADLDPQSPGDEGIKIYLTPHDADGDILKAAGAVTVEVFDLSLKSNPRIGQWSFTAREAADHWLGSGLMFGYVLTCPWQTPPAGGELTLKITFTDSLTGRSLDRQTVVKVVAPSKPAPPTTQTP